MDSMIMPEVIPMWVSGASFRVKLGQAEMQ